MKMWLHLPTIICLVPYMLYRSVFNAQSPEAGIRDGRRYS